MSSPRSLTRPVLAAAALGLAVLASCGKTTIVDVTTTTDGAAVTTTTLPAGSPAALAEQLRDLAFTLGPAIVDGVGRATLQKIDALWAAIISQVPRTQFVEDAGHQLDLMRAAVERKRPADADKAALHLEALVNSALTALQGA